MTLTDLTKIETAELLKDEEERYVLRTTMVSGNVHNNIYTLEETAQKHYDEIRRTMKKSMENAQEKFS